jgi:hypothetical protein
MLLLRVLEKRLPFWYKLRCLFPAGGTEMRTALKSCVIIACLTVAAAAAAQEAPDFKVRSDRPRIMLTPERVKALKDKLTGDEIPGKDAGAKALRYALTGDEAAAKEAVDALLKFDVPDDVLANKVASDDYRWAAAIPAMYDWCNDKLTDDEKARFLARYGHIVEAMNAKSWGGYSMPGSNYYAGYMRNSAIFGLAAFGETPLAQTALVDALVKRWHDSTLPYYETGAKGGVIGEGSQYDRYNAGYVMWLAEAVRTATGRDIMKETNWFREFAYQTIYSTAPTLTYANGVDDPYFQRFPFGDCEMWQGHPNVDEYIGDAMRMIALEYAGEKVGGHAQAYLDEVEPPAGLLGWIIEDGRTVEPGDLSELPLDYYAPGTGFAYSRSDWEEGGTQLMLQLGVPTKGSHLHLDAGSFQMLRAGRWMTRESTGYGTRFNGCTSNDSLAHNMIVFKGPGDAKARGQANAYADGDPEIIAVETGRDFFHAAVDLSRAYRASSSSHKDRDDNPYCARLIREFIYVKPDLLIIFDRAMATTPDAEITSVIHFPVKPKFTKSDEFGDLFTAENGGSQFVAHTVYPKDVEYKTVDEGQVEGKKAGPGFYQWRVEATQKGRTEAYFLTVVAAQMRFDLEPQCVLVEEDGVIGATIKQPGRKTEVRFAKAVGDSLGKLVIDAAGAYGHSESDLPKKIQAISAGPGGPAWGEPLEKPWPIDPSTLKKR